MMRFLNAKARITIGLVGIIVSLILLASFLKIIPDKYSADVERRTVLAETITVYSTALVKSASTQRLKEDFELLTERNTDLWSLALRRNDGTLLVATEDHDLHWKTTAGEYSTNSQIKVPIWSGEEKWGQLELNFSPLVAVGILGVFSNPLVQMVLFMGCCCFVIYYFYLGKVLRQLDPSQAIPGRVRSALDTMAEGLLILDRKGQIVLANLAFATIIDKPASELLGYRAGELPWSDREGKKLAATQRPWALALAEGRVVKDRTVRLQLPDLSFRTFRTNSSPVLGDKGKYAGVLVSFDDITELEKKEHELLLSKNEAVEANRAKSSFLANMSHEIRTPMNAILGFTEILKRGYIKNEQESLRYLNTIHSSGKNLLELINDILDLSKVESGALEIEKIMVCPYRVIHDVVQILHVKAEEKGIDLTFKVTSELPEEIETDPVRLRQIVLNLIGNSIKFTEQGGVAVSCRLIQAAGNPQLVVDIKDTGIGMSEDAQKRIFNPFVQADTSVSRRFGGTGLGLAISLKFAQALGGDIRVQSEPGKGSTFSVAVATGNLDGVKFLQPQEINQLQQSHEDASQTRWQFSSAKVLVVDDGPENRELIKLLLEDAGLTIEEAENGQVAVDKVNTGNYAVILMDVNMPVMDGLTAVGIMRSKGLNIPIVALTANAMKGDIDRCLAAGYSDYFSKPINVDLFMDLMTRLLGGEKVAGAEHSVNAASQPVELLEAATAVDNSPINSTLPVQIEKFRNIVVRFVERLAGLLDEMDQAAELGNFKELASLAHTLKGSGGTVGFAAFTEPAAELEIQAKEQNLPAIGQSLALLRKLAARIVVDGSKIKAVNTEKQTVSVAAEASPAVEQHPIVSSLASKERMHHIIHAFLDELETKLKLMDQALKAENFIELASLAHWLKGSGGTVGYSAFTQPAEALENFSRLHQLKPAVQMVKDIQAISRRLVPPGEPEDIVEKISLKTG